MKKYNVVIQDLNKPDMPTITEMIVSDYKALTGTLMHFKHPDGSVTVTNIAPGWDLTITLDED